MPLYIYIFYSLFDLTYHHTIPFQRQSDWHGMHNECFASYRIPQTVDAVVCFYGCVCVPACLYLVYNCLYFVSSWDERGEGVLNDSVKEHSFSRRCVQGLAELLNHILSFGACLCFDLVYNQSESLLQQANFRHISTYANISHPLNITLLSL